MSGLGALDTSSVYTLDIRLSRTGRSQTLGGGLTLSRLRYDAFMFDAILSVIRRRKRPTSDPATWQRMRRTSYSRGITMFLRGEDGGPPPGYVTARELRRVVPIVKSLEVGPGRVTLTSLDIYADGSILNCRAHALDPSAYVDPSEDEIAALMEEFKKLSETEADQSAGTLLKRFQTSFMTFFSNEFLIRLQDDLGTDYSDPLPGPGGGSNIDWHAAFTYTPPIPRSARRIRLVLGSSRATAESESPPEGVVAPRSIVVDL